MKFNKEAKSYGFQDHDILLGTDIRPFKNFGGDVFRDISEAQYCDVMRNGKKVRINLPGNLNLLNMLKVTPQFARPFVPAVADTVYQTIPVTESESVASPAWQAGMRKGDKILAVNGKAIDSYNEFTEAVGVISDQLAAVSTHKDSLRLRTVSLVIEKAGAKRDTVTATLTPDVKLGFAVGGPEYMYKDKITHVSYSFLSSFPAGVKYGWDVLSGYVSDMKYVFTADGAKSLGGFGAIGSLFPQTWDWHAFWMMTAFLSIILAFMNILPIPALDGGHVLFLLYEIITRRKPSENFLIKAEYVGITVLVLLMVVANLNDILRWIGVM